jgi:hypothetical protein
MTKTFNLLLSGALVLAASATTLARTPVVNKREHRQQTRIRQGIRSGELTFKEALRLEREQASIRRKEARAKADGVVTLGERARLHRELDQANRHIRRQKHD